LELDPDYADAQYLMGYLNFKKPLGRGFAQAQKAWLSYLDLVALDCPKRKHYVFFYLGDMFYQTDQWKDAIHYLSLFLEDVDKIKNDRDYDKASNLLKWSKFLDHIYSHPMPFEPELVHHINTKADEFLAIISPDNELSFFTRRTLDPEAIHNNSGIKYKESFCWATVQNNGYFDEGTPMPYPFNQGKNEGGASLSLDRKHLFYTVCQEEMAYQNCDIYTSDWNGAYWSDLQALNAKINGNSTWESQACVSSDGNMLYFVSDRKGGFGGNDIWISTKNQQGEWDSVRNAGERINTAGNEKSPFIHPDKHTFYFSSDAWMGLGGYDIFYLKLDDPTMKVPINIGYPINSTEDETGFFVSLDGEYGYFSSNKIKERLATQKFEGGGGWDLYRFKLYEKARPDKVILIRGQIDENIAIDTNGERSAFGKIEIQNLKTKTITEVDVDSASGKYASIIQRDTDLLLTYSGENIAFDAKLIQVEKANDNKAPLKIQIDLQPQKITKGEAYPLNDLYFETASFELNAQSKIILESFTNYLVKHPHLEIEIKGYTDDVGDDAYNLLLSKNRAKAVYDYMMQISPLGPRLSYKGYGKAKMEKLSEKERALYRKIVFLVK
ncbi:MAG: OmpA family protein, partial [Bacteroidales bacterium]